MALLVTLVPFLGSEGETPQHPHAPPLDMWLSPLILGALGLMLGLLPAALGEMLLSPAASAVYGQPLELHLSALPTTLTPMLLLSGVTIAGGIAIYAGRRRMQALYDRLNPSLSAERLYDRFHPCPAAPGR